MRLLSEDDTSIHSNRVALFKFLSFMKINEIEIVLSCFLILKQKKQRTMSQVLDMGLRTSILRYFTVIDPTLPILCYSQWANNSGDQYPPGYVK
jgi:hypothetical protein